MIVLHVRIRYPTFLSPLENGIIEARNSPTKQGARYVCVHMEIGAPGSNFGAVLVV